MAQNLIPKEHWCNLNTNSLYRNKFDEAVYTLTDEDLRELSVVKKDPLCIKEDGFNPNSDALNLRDRCTKYVVCKGGRLLPGRRDCPATLTYDPNAGNCVFPKENSYAGCKAMDPDTKRLNNFCRRRFIEGKFRTGTTHLFQSVKNKCAVFIMCIKPFEHKFGTCEPDKSYHSARKMCLKHMQVPGCEHRHYPYSRQYI